VRIVLFTRRLLARPDGTPATAVLGARDQAALATAVRLRRAGAEVLVAVAAGPAERQEPALRQALAQGADRAVSVSHALLEKVDYHGMARVLAGAAKHLGYELVLLGERSQDEAEGAIGPAVAEHLGVPHVTAARDLTIELPDHVRFERLDGTLRRTLRLALPAVITVAADGLAGGQTEAEPAQGREPETLDLETIGIQPPELKYRDRCLGRAMPVRALRSATVLPRAADLVARLRDDHLLGD